MLDDFAQLLAEVFPSVEPETARRLIEAAKRRHPLAAELYGISPLGPLSQGDIVGPLPFRILDEDAQWVASDGFGLVLSHSCDVDHDDSILISHGFRFSELTAATSTDISFSENVKRNLINRLFYLPAVPGASDLTFDLSLVNSFSALGLLRSLATGTTHRYASLSQFGYYLFLAKLTVHLLRPETEVQRQPLAKVTFLGRVRAALHVLRA